MGRVIRLDKYTLMTNSKKWHMTHSTNLVEQCFCPWWQNRHCQTYHLVKTSKMSSVLSKPKLLYNLLLISEVIAFLLVHLLSAWYLCSPYACVHFTSGVCSIMTHIGVMVTFQVTPWKNLSFADLRVGHSGFNTSGDWAASGLVNADQPFQVNALLYSMGPKAEDKLNSLHHFWLPTRWRFTLQ